MINKKNFRRVLKIVEEAANDTTKRRGKFAKRFDYRIWFRHSKKHATVADVIKHPCGTTGCIGGWACVLAIAEDTPEASLQHGDIYNDTVAAQFLGIEGDEAHYLFYGYWHPRMTYAPAEDIVAKLKNIIRTGAVINRRFDQKFEL